MVQRAGMRRLDVVTRAGHWLSATMSCYSSHGVNLSTKVRIELHRHTHGKCGVLLGATALSRLQTRCFLPVPARGRGFEGLRQHRGLGGCKRPTATALAGEKVQREGCAAVCVCLFFEGTRLILVKRGAKSEFTHVIGGGPYFDTYSYGFRHRIIRRQGSCANIWSELVRGSLRNRRHKAGNASPRRLEAERHRAAAGVQTATDPEGTGDVALHVSTLCKHAVNQTIRKLGKSLFWEHPNCSDSCRWRI